MGVLCCCNIYFILVYPDVSLALRRRDMDAAASHPMTSSAAHVAAVLAISLAAGAGPLLASSASADGSASQERENISAEEVISEPAIDLLSWPHCLENSTAVWRLTPLLPSNADQALYANVQAFGAVSGCYQNDCVYSDKFAASSMESCAQVCLSLPACSYWMWGKEEDEILPAPLAAQSQGKQAGITKTKPLTKCWLRKSDAGREGNVTGWTSAAKSCHPPGTEVLVAGNKACWMQDFDYTTCCALRHGAGGNANCWDDMWNYDKCCLPELVL